MRGSLATRFSATIAGVVLMASLSSVAAIVGAWHIGAVLESTIEGDLASIRAGEELEVALLVQRGLVSSYVLGGGDRAWLEELQRRKPEFDRWLAVARATAQTRDERQSLAGVEQAYRELDTKRNEAIALYNRGETAAATQMLVQEVNRRLHARAYDQCKAFIAANDRQVDSATEAANQRMRLVTWVVGMCVAVTAGLGAVLLWEFFFGVLFPLRRMVADARVFKGETSSRSVRPAEDELREVGGYLRSLMLDVADTRSRLARSRSRLESAEKLASVGKLAAGVAHEIRNPLTAMKMWLFSIRESARGNAEVERKCAIVSEEITRLEHIVRNFLEFSRPPALDRRPQDVCGLIERTLELIGPRIREKQIRLVRETAAGLRPALADAEQLKQVLINLLDNAAEATPAGGEIHVATAAGRDADGRPMIVVRIRDTGPGMPDDVRQRIFEPFFTTKDDGTGLGLCIAARIMAQHEGHLSLESSTPRGTVFAVWTPTAKAQRDEQNSRG